MHGISLRLKEPVHQATTGEDNATLTLDEGLRFTVTNLGATGHPFQLLDANGDNVLIAAGGGGSLQADADANVRC